MEKLKSIKAKERKLRKLRKKTQKLIDLILPLSKKTDMQIATLTNAYNIMRKTDKVAEKVNEILKRLK